jgi:tRNA 2-thiocytidine biosynthesis protein TtcA
MFAELEVDHPHLKETMLSAMGNLDTGRLLDTRFLNLVQEEPRELFRILGEAVGD